MSADEVRIGDFSQPVVPPPTTTRSPAEEALKTAEKTFDEAAQKDEAALQPMLTYEQKLKDLKITRTKAAEIIDAVLVKGYYAEDVPVTKTLNVRLRTRGARDTKRAQDMIENQRLSYDAHYGELMSRYLLAASLERFGSDKFSHPSKGAKPEEIEEAYKQRLAYVEDLSDPALRLLIAKTIRFDKMIAVVLEEGSIENF
jgi:hypothetical protein